jgi:addiction module HigA family antidote
MEMFNPPHPGEIIREDCLKPLELTVTEAALRLGVSRQSMSELINGRNGVSADMALRLEKAGWSTALSWLRNQAAYDLWQARNQDEFPDRMAGKSKSTLWRFSAPHALRKTSQPKSFDTAEKATAKKRAAKKTAAKAPKPGKRRA